MKFLVLAVIATGLFLFGGGLLIRRVFRKKIRPIWGRIEELEAAVRMEQSVRTQIQQLLASALVLPEIHPAVFTAQYGEDLLAWSFFDRSMQGIFVELGGYNGITFSNTYALEKLGWQGMIVEADPVLYRQCVNARPGSYCVHAAVGGNTAQGHVVFSSVQSDDKVSPLSFLNADEKHRNRCADEGGRIVEVSVPYCSVNSLLEDSGLPRIDLLSIDIEGMELEVLNAIDYTRFAPRLIIVEANGRERRQDILMEMTKKGYQLWRETACNLLLVSERAASAAGLYRV